MSEPARSNLLAVIPARGGSRRIPRKNLREIAGRPMIAHTIEAALASGLFDDVVVSTDDVEIARVARAAGAHVPFRRDEAIADDRTPVSAVTLDALVRLESEDRRYESVAQLMPNCPLRTASDVQESYAAFRASPYASQISVVRFGGFNPWWAMRRKEDGGLDPVFPEALTRRSQDLEDLFCPTGAIWWIRPDVLRREGTFHIEQRGSWEIAWHHGIDIDEEEDLALASHLATLRNAPR